MCAVVVSMAAVQLRPLQQANKTQDVQRNILAAAGFADVKDVSATFNANIEARVVNLESGEFVETDPNSFDFEMTVTDVTTGVTVVSNTDTQTFVQTAALNGAFFLHAIQFNNGILTLSA